MWIDSSSAPLGLHVCALGEVVWCLGDGAPCFGGNEGPLSPFDFRFLRVSANCCYATTVRPRKIGLLLSSVEKAANCATE